MHRGHAASDPFTVAVQQVKWYRLAAEHGSSEAMYRLGLILLAGNVEEHNEVEAKKWLGEAFKSEHVLAAVVLGGLARRQEHWELAKKCYEFAAGELASVRAVTPLPLLPTPFSLCLSCNALLVQVAPIRRLLPA
jgi:TPR repeat protein